MSAHFGQYKFIYIALAFVALGVGAWAVFGRDGETKRADDYLSPELREQVNQLKKDVLATPTTDETFLARTTVLWQWANAFSMTGKAYDTAIPGFVRAVRQSVVLKEPATEDDFKFLDNAVYALGLVDDDPHALGEITIDSHGPYRADSYQTVTVTYVLGNAGIKTGGGVIAAEHFMPDNMDFQTTEPSKENYVSIKASKSGVTFKGEPHDYGASPLGKPTFFRLTEGTLDKGDQITVTYGDTSAGSPGLHMPTYSNDGIPFQLFLDFEGDGRFVSLPRQTITTTGMEAEGVHGFAPSIVKTGELFEISVRTQDHYYNRATGPIPAYDVYLNGEKYGTIAAGQEAIHLMKDVSFNKEGIYRFTFQSQDGKIMGVANPILVQNNPAHRIYWGETHAHSGMAEGLGSTKGFWEFGRDDALLDFLAHTDHDTAMDDYEWSIVRQNAIDFYEPGKFIPYLAYEYSAEYRLGGHHNVLFRNPENRLRVPNQDFPVIAKLHEGLLKNNKAEDVLVIPHAHNPGDWNISNSKLENLTEIMSSHGTFEWFSQRYLEKGWQVGFAGGSDDHLNHPGYNSPWHLPIARNQVGGLTAVFASERSRDAIFDNLKARQTYTTTNERMILEMNVNGVLPGNRIDFSPNRKIEGRVICTAPIDTITLVKNSKAFSVQDLMTDKSPLVLPAKSVHVQLAFHSDSNPPPGVERATPRGPRIWVGTITVTGATLVNAKPLDFDNPRLQSLERAADSNNEVHYRTITRGDRSSIELDLADVTANATITVVVDASVAKKATGGGSLNDQGKAGKQQLPMETHSWQLSALNQDTRVKPIQSLDGYKDTLSLRRMKEGVTLDSNFAFEDKNALGVGDYYYVRVEQIDGAIAWSSPVWIGGTLKP